MWIEAIRQATPHSPRPARKEPPKDTPIKAEPVDRPKYTQRQETVDVAAKVASEAASQPDVEDVRPQYYRICLWGIFFVWFSMVSSTVWVQYSRHLHSALLKEALQEHVYIETTA